VYFIGKDLHVFWFVNWPDFLAIWSPTQKYWKNLFFNSPGQWRFNTPVWKSYRDV